VVWNWVTSSKDIAISLQVYKWGWFGDWNPTSRNNQSIEINKRLKTTVLYIRPKKITPFPSQEIKDFAWFPMKIYKLLRVTQPDNCKFCIINTSYNLNFHISLSQYNDWQLDDWKTRVLFLAGASRLALGPTCPHLKWLWHEADYSPPFNAKVKRERSYTCVYHMSSCTMLNEVPRTTLPSTNLHMLEVLSHHHFAMQQIS
jgi:hypothetical protein